MRLARKGIEAYQVTGSQIKAGSRCACRRRSAQWGKAPTPQAAENVRVADGKRRATLSARVAIRSLSATTAGKDNV